MALVVVVAVGLILWTATPSPARFWRSWEPYRPPVTTISDRSWIAEDEFDADPTLHAREGQTVVLRLEPWAPHWKTLLRVFPGDPCQAVTLTPGFYIIEAFHDHRNVPDGKSAFLRLPDATRLTGDPLSAQTAVLSFMAWKGANGNFVTVPSGEGNLAATATTVDEHTVWKLDGTGNFQMTDGVGNPVQCQANTSVRL
jgi:hypothetical protein